MRLQFFLLTSARKPHTRPRPVSPPVPLSIKLSPWAGTIPLVPLLPSKSFYAGQVIFYSWAMT